MGSARDDPAPAVKSKSTGETTPVTGDPCMLQVTALREMFPMTDRSVIQHVLEANGGDLDSSVNDLLVLSDTSSRAPLAPHRDAQYARQLAQDDQIAYDRRLAEASTLKYQPRKKKSGSQSAAQPPNGAGQPPPLPERRSGSGDDHGTDRNEPTFFDKLDKEVPIYMERLDKLSQEAGESVQRWMGKMKKKYNEKKAERNARASSSGNAEAAGAGTSLDSRKTKKDDFQEEYDRDHIMILDNDLDKLGLKDREEDGLDDLYAPEPANDKVIPNNYQSAQTEGKLSNKSPATSTLPEKPYSRPNTPSKAGMHESKSPPIDASKLGMLPKRQIDLLTSPRVSSPTKALPDSKQTTGRAGNYDGSHKQAHLDDEDDEFVRNPFDEDDD